MSANNQKIKIGIIGCGQMGSCFAQHFGNKHELFLYDKTFEKSKKLGLESGGIPLRSAVELVKHVDVILLAIKPQNLSAIASEIKVSLQPNHLLISILSGVTSPQLQNYFGHNAVLRIMPNLAIKYEKGVIGLSEVVGLTHETKNISELLFSSFGTLFWISEDKMDALTALTGSGPAFAFVMIEAMVEAGISMGFSTSQSSQLVIEMLKGSLTLLEKTRQHPADLKWQVCSPAGTTIAGLITLEHEKVRFGIISAFLAAKERSQQLAMQKGQDC